MPQQTYDLKEIADQVMDEKGLRSAFSDAAMQQVRSIHSAALDPSSKDLRSLLWCSIDNDDSRDLDQLTFAEKLDTGSTALWVAIADVEGLVLKNSAVDEDAEINTTSVYTPAKIFPMLPEKLSTDLTSLNEAQDRMALVVRIFVDANSEIKEPTIFQGIVKNRAKLTYNAVGAWLSGTASVPKEVMQVAGLETALLLQSEVAQRLKKKRDMAGALTLESPEPRIKLLDQKLTIEPTGHNLAQDLIEQFMISANHVMALKFRELKIPSLRRVVRIPKKWDRIVQCASELNEYLPPQPDAKALEQFLIKRKKADPKAFPELSLTIIKLLGRGEYIVENFPDKPIGHFGLALEEYMHATAPNRRFPDLISQRLYLAYLRKQKAPYSSSELAELAAHCTEQEDAAMKVERHLNKSAAGILLSSRIGSVFDGIVTGSNEKGTWVRIRELSIEGKVIKGFERVDVGDKVRVKLVSVDVPRGYINLSIAN